MMDMADRKGSETGNDEKRRKTIASGWNRVVVGVVRVCVVQLDCPDVEAGGGGKQDWRLGGLPWVCSVVVAGWLAVGGRLSGAGCVLPTVTNQQRRPLWFVPRGSRRSTSARAGQQKCLALALRTPDYQRKARREATRVELGLSA